VVGGKGNANVWLGVKGIGNERFVDIGVMGSAKTDGRAKKVA
jgi:hypothetical protein